MCNRHRSVGACVPEIGSVGRCVCPGNSINVSQCSLSEKCLRSTTVSPIPAFEVELRSTLKHARATGFALASLSRRRSSRRRSSRARSTLYACRTRSSRPSMVLNFRASSTCNTLHDADDDVHSDLQVHKPSRSCRNEVSRSRLTALCACAGSRDSHPDVTSRRRRG